MSSYFLLTWGVQILCIFNQNQTPRSDSANLEPSETIFCPQILEPRPPPVVFTDGSCVGAVQLRPYVALRRMFCLQAWGPQRSRTFMAWYTRNSVFPSGSYVSTASNSELFVGSLSTTVAGSQLRPPVSLRRIRTDVAPLSPWPKSFPCAIAIRVPFAVVTCHAAGRAQRGSVCGRTGARA